MEVADNLLCILQVVCGYLGRLMVSGPLDGVLQARVAPSSAAVQAGVQDLLNFELFYAVDFYWRWGVLSLTRLGVTSRGA